MTLNLSLAPAGSREQIRHAPYRRTWTLQELVAHLRVQPVRALDVGAGRHPLHLRRADEVVTLDFDTTCSPTVATDFTKSWPFLEGEFDFIYLSHVIEHLYPRDRDELIRNIYKSTRPGGFVLIRVPHRSSVQATGWEHYTLYGMNGAMSLCHGYNPTLPMFRAVSVGVALSIEFDRHRSYVERAIERLLNRRFRLTDQVLSKLIGGIEEVQFLLQRMPVSDENAVRSDQFTGYAN